MSQKKNNNKYTLNVRYFDRGFSLTMNEDQFKKINDNEVTIYVQPYNLKILEKVIKKLQNFKICIKLKKYE